MTYNYHCRDDVISVSCLIAAIDSDHGLVGKYYNKVQYTFCSLGSILLPLHECIDCGREPNLVIFSIQYSLHAHDGKSQGVSLASM